MQVSANPKAQVQGFQDCLGGWEQPTSTTVVSSDRRTQQSSTAAEHVSRASQDLMGALMRCTYTGRLIDVLHEGLQVFQIDGGGGATACNGLAPRNGDGGDLAFAAGVMAASCRGVR